MIEKIKVIDLLALISANSIPKRFIWGDVLWIFDEGRHSYYSEGKGWDVFYYMDKLIEYLNDEIELLEEIVEPGEEDIKELEEK